MSWYVQPCFHYVRLKGKEVDSKNQLKMNRIESALEIKRFHPEFIRYINSSIVVTARI